MDFYFNNKEHLLFLCLVFISNFLFNSCSKDEFPLLHEPPFNIEIDKSDSELNFVLNKPWEKIGIGYINVIKTDSIWKLWYETFDENSLNIGKGDYNGYFCYATSKDGINWIKPNLKMTQYNGNCNNNIVISNNGIKNNGVHGVTVFIDSLAPSDEKYKMIYTRWIDSLSTNWVYGMTSPDGINWENQRLLIKQYSDTQTVCFYDNGIYKIYLRYWNGGSHAKGYRQIGYTESANFDNLFSNYIPVKFDDGPDSQKLHLYNNAVNFINDSLYICFPSIFSPSEDKMQIEIGYNTSNDPTKFSFYNFGTNNIENSTEYRGLYAAPRLVKINDKSFWLYYMATPKGHKSNLYPDYTYQGKIKRVLINVNYNK